MIFSALTSKIFGGIAIAAITFGAIQTVRIEGLLFIKGYRERLEIAQLTIKQMDEAGKSATIRQAEIFDKRTEKEKANAQIADAKFEGAQATGVAAATRYITRWRVRDNQSCASAADGTAQGESAGVPEAMPTGAVLVSEGDVLACTGATAYAIEAHNDTMRRIEAGIAE